MKKYLFVIILIAAFKTAFPQSSNVTLQSKWMSGVDFKTVFVDGSYAYCSMDSIMFIVDITNPSAIRAVSQVILSDNIFWIYVTNSKAYLTLGYSGLSIVDVSNPYIPVKMGNCPIAGLVREAKVLGNYAYVEADTAGMKIIDVSNANAPVQVSFFNLGSSSVSSIDVSGNYAYLAYGTNGLQIVDITNPLNPTVAGFLNLSYAYKVVVSGSHAYMIADSMYIINISNVSLPVIESKAGSSFPYAASGFFVSGNYVYTFTTSSFLEIWDVSNSFSPFLAGSYSNGTGFPNCSQGIFVSGATGYFIRTSFSSNKFGSFEIFNVSVANSIIKIGKYIQPQIYTGICTSGNLVYSCGWTPPGNEMISIFDITDAYHPQQLAYFVDSFQYSFGEGSKIVKSGNYLYLSATRTGPSNSWGFKIIDVTNPSSPVKTGMFNVTSDVSSGIAVNGNYAYVCYNNGGVRVVDVSNPALPVQVSALILTGGFSPYDLFISGNYAYVIDNASKMHIVDITNPLALIDAGTYQLPATGSDIYAEGNYAYVAVGGHGLQIIDVSTPAAPSFVGSYTAVSNDIRTGIYKYGNFVYLNDVQNGLQVIDVTNKANPVQAGYYYNITGLARNVFADSLHSYLSTDGGLYIFEGGTSTSIETHAAYKNPLTVFPNPFQSYVTFSIQKKSTGNISYTIKNVLGQTLFTKQTSAIHSSWHETGYLAFLSKGIYFLDVKIEDEHLVQKLVKE